MHAFGLNRKSFAALRAAVGLACLAHAAVAGAQARDPRAVQPERPTVSNHASTVAPGWTEFESGVEVDRGPGSARNVIAGTSFKLGTGTHTQLSMLATAAQFEGVSGGIGDLAFTFKWRMADADRVFGDFAIVPTLKLATGSARRGTGTGTTDASVLLVSSRDAGPVHVDANIGYTVRSGGAGAPGDQGVWAVASSGTLDGSFGWTAEVFGYSGTRGARPLVGMLFGPTVTLSSRLVLDFAAALPVSGPQPRALIAGATYSVGRIY